MPSTDTGFYGGNKFNNPSYIIIDKDGKLPLSLSREKFLTENFNFNDMLIKSMSNYLFEELIQFKVKKQEILNKTYFDNQIYKVRDWNGISKFHTSSIYKKFIFSETGFNLFNSYVVEKNSISKLVFIEFKDKEVKKNRIKFITSLLDKGINVLVNHSDIDSNSNGYSYLFKMIESKYINLDKSFLIKSANFIMPTSRYKQIFTYAKQYLNVTLKDSVLTSNEMIKKNKSIIPASEESKNFSRNYFNKEEDSIFTLVDIDEYSEDIGLIVEVDIKLNNPRIQPEIEYYFYNLMEEYFKDKEHCWMPYAE